jgi:hypothetical protein
MNCGRSISGSGGVFRVPIRHTACDLSRPLGLETRAVKRVNVINIDVVAGLWEPPFPSPGSVTKTSFQ